MKGCYKHMVSEREATKKCIIFATAMRTFGTRSLDALSIRGRRTPINTSHDTAHKATKIWI